VIQLAARRRPFLQHYFCIHGGTPLAGTVTVSGSKNASLPILAASLAIDGCSIIRNLPALLDVRTMLLLLQSTGGQILQPDDSSSQPSCIPRCVRVLPPTSAPAPANESLVRRMRAGICLLGPLLAKFGAATIPLPGGCRIGPRPIDLHLRGLAALGANLHVTDGWVHAHADRLNATDLDLAGPAGPTVTGTCNVLSAAVLAHGTTIIRNAAQEPEVSELARFLNAAGARIEFPEPGILEIHGVEQLTAPDHTVFPDRIEAATLAIAAAATHGDIRISNAPVDHLQAFLEWISDVGVHISHSAEGLRIECPGPIRPKNVTAEPYPGIPTDLQAQMTALLSIAPGTSTVTDRVFPERFQHIHELNRLGGSIACENGTASIHGVSRLHGGTVRATDLRASAALVIAALAAHGTTEIHEIQHLDRGYEQMDIKLQQLGASIQRRVSESFVRT
jgi:UDP-N-acetylglucosamine 1-carboxyvinyltransferase